jgi:hypothetical protein
LVFRSPGLLRVLDGAIPPPGAGGVVHGAIRYDIWHRFPPRGWYSEGSLGHCDTLRDLLADTLITSIYAHSAFAVQYFFHSTYRCFVLYNPARVYMFLYYWSSHICCHFRHALPFMEYIEPPLICAHKTIVAMFTVFSFHVAVALVIWTFA